MPTLKRTVQSRCEAGRAFAYLCDFENAVEWDSGTVRCTRTSGDGGPGTVYHNVSKFVGRQVELDYTVESVAEPRFVIVGRNATATSRDTIVVTPRGEGCEVVYRADFTFTGGARFLGPVMQVFLERLGDATARTLREALDRQ
jgi:Polyketide cyclase / dehydrase and lipid transport